MRTLNEIVINEEFDPIGEIVTWLRSIYTPKREMRTYTKGQDEVKFDGFLYMIAPVVSNQVFEQYKKYANDSDALKEFYTRMCDKTGYELSVEEFFETIALYVRAKSIKLFSSNRDAKGDITKLSEADRESITYYDEFPQYVIYHFTILKNEKTLEDFIFKKWETNKLGANDFRNEDDARYIIKRLTDMCDTLLRDEIYSVTGAKNIKQMLAAYKQISSKLYDEINSEYMYLYKKYVEFVENKIK